MTDLGAFQAKFLGLGDPPDEFRKDQRICKLEVIESVYDRLEEVMSTHGYPGCLSLLEQCGLKMSQQSFYGYMRQVRIKRAVAK